VLFDQLNVKAALPQQGGSITARRAPADDQHIVPLHIRSSLRST
jgi:hypothetical protein